MLSETCVYLLLTLSTFCWFRSYQENRYIVNFSAFLRGVGTIPPEVGRVNCKRLMKHSVAAVCAHASFDSKYYIMKILTCNLHVE